MEVSWTPITYTGDTGGYRVFSSTTPGGPYTEEGMTADKSASSLTVDGLNPSTTYYFVVVTRTNPHGNNSNTVNSDLSEEVSEQSLNIEMQDNITAANSRTGILLQWVTASETGNAGFHVWRSLEEEGRYERMTALIIPGAGNSSEEHSYSYLDTRVESQGIYWYKVEQLDVSGCSKFFGPLRVERVYHLPEEFFLSRNYPNPFNPSTTLDYQLPVDTYVTIAVYDLLGRQIRVLVDSRVDAGYHKVSWDGTDASGRMVANGIYLIQMQTEDFRWVQKLSVIK